eukprot:GFKZ01005016.1.p1 GENE.GFKZ01005016.1~~GFKZ01005016.1.p1  ORF type:complete len:526 (-),score=112.53 GFKZ01005016.1:355-1932(-)
MPSPPPPKTSSLPWRFDPLLLETWKLLAAEYSLYNRVLFSAKVAQRLHENCQGSDIVITGTMVLRRIHELRNSYVKTLERSLEGKVRSGRETEEFEYFKEVQDILLTSRRARLAKRKDSAQGHGNPKGEEDLAQARSAVKGKKRESAVRRVYLTRRKEEKAATNAAEEAKQGGGCEDDENPRHSLRDSKGRFRPRMTSEIPEKTVVRRKYWNERRASEREREGGNEGGGALGNVGGSQNEQAIDGAEAPERELGNREDAGGRNRGNPHEGRGIENSGGGEEKNVDYEGDARLDRGVDLREREAGHDGKGGMQDDKGTGRGEGHHDGEGRPAGQGGVEQRDEVAGSGRGVVEKGELFDRGGERGLRKALNDVQRINREGKNNMEGSDRRGRVLSTEDVIGDKPVPTARLRSEEGNGNRGDGGYLKESEIKEEVNEVCTVQATDSGDSSRGKKRRRKEKEEGGEVKDDTEKWEAKIRLVEELRKCATVMKELGMTEDAESILHTVIEVVDEIGLEGMKKSRASGSGD